MNDLIEVAYLATAVCFILALKLMNSPKTARRGNLLAAAGMALALIATFFLRDPTSGRWVLGNYEWMAGAFVFGTVAGVWSARRVQMTAMPQMVALFNGLGGGAVALVALIEAMQVGGMGHRDMVQAVTTVLSLFIGAISFSGSLIAFAKLQELMTGRPITYFGQKVVNLLLLAGCIALMILLCAGPYSLPLFLTLLGASLAIGILFVLPIGGADMPVVISLLNSFTGCAAGLAGFVLGNTALLIGGGLVGASGLILTLEMCKAMNRSLENVVFGAFGSAPSGASSTASALQGSVRSYSVEDAAIIFASAESVVIVPGYGMAVAQAQHVVKELADRLTAKGIDVKYAIHPVAGRMPGHMNVLLAEADVPYDQLFDLEEINPMFVETDVALVIGANDVVNPAARYDKASPIYGMPILDVDKARTVIVCKRGMSPGFAGIENELFLQPNTIMVFGNAKQTIAKLSSAAESL
ncbi:MAG TPA: NAD(P)(+) transhydrogenase (Re/Si-specific) subunit beta [Fimbriimonadaceae bacterium]|nr:NAD(P)(+) transhydrogenase (Re/Si-specific) subunit beta [Fimbriimonadaceae bacterium]HRJ95310.1 NAD(P)(+) transhydrogenase (Re/Si-specific) subunit beta [Fimbriimonadaceae bacterium]